ncbi:MAG: hypothetical protein Q4E84_07340 [Clostridia bacterium]|nr:hypothetical protein [Clostridia bacterium]
MKKFLSMLLALSVVFTYTFGAASSVFAASTSYTKDEAKNVLQTAYGQAKAEAYDADYDGTTVGTKDITVFEIDAAKVQKGITKLYEEAYNLINTGADTVTTIAGVAMTGTEKTDIAYLVAYLESKATTEENALNEVYAAAFDDYKAFLTGLVDKVDVSIYTTTKQDTAYTAKDGKEYSTAKEAADADIAYAKAVISKAKFDASVGSTAPASNSETWKVKSYQDLYAAVFGDAKVIRTVEVKDKISDAVTGLSYKLVAAYATAASEAGDAATLAAAQAAAKAKLAQAIANFKATDDYVAADHDAELNAYVEVQNFIIDNETKANVDALTFTVNKALADATAYQAKLAAVKNYADDMAAAKVKYTAMGYTWNDAKAAKAEKEATLALYKTGTAMPTVDKTYLTTTKGIVSSDLTASAKAAAKIDYSDVVAKVDNTVATGAKVYQLPVEVKYTKASKTGAIDRTKSGEKYFEAQWTKVKAAVDTYNAAVAASVTSKDIEAATNALAAAIDEIKTASTVYTAVSAASQANLNAYAKLAFNQAKAADSTLINIYVTFTTVDEAVNDTTTLDTTSVNLWYIAKGAETKKEAEAMYKDACAVIDGYKTLTTLKADAAAVTAKIAALPAAKNVVLGDKAAIVDAFDAYDALGTTAKSYVTNKVVLDAAVKAVEPLEAYDVKAKAVALPNTAFVTVADKEAVKAAKAAYKAYAGTDAYATKSLNRAPYDYDTALGNIKNLEVKAIKADYNTLDAKYASNTLKAEDKAAVEKLQKAVADFIDEYGVTPDATVEEGIAKIADAVAKLVEAEKWTDKDVKANLLDMNRKVTIWRTSKKSIRVTAVGSVSEIKENGYTVKYTFYKKAPGAKAFKAVKTTTSNKFVYKNLKKGTNKFQVKVSVYNAEGKLVASKTTFYKAVKVK